MDYVFPLPVGVFEKAAKCAARKHYAFVSGLPYRIKNNEIAQQVIRLGYLWLGRGSDLTGSLRSARLVRGPSVLVRKPELGRNQACSTDLRLLLFVL